MGHGTAWSGRLPCKEKNRRVRFSCAPPSQFWDEDPDILEVHHIDENREHNELSNLVILCPICHRKITSHKYKLIERNSIIPI